MVAFHSTVLKVIKLTYSSRLIFFNFTCILMLLNHLNWDAKINNMKINLCLLIYANSANVVQLSTSVRFFLSFYVIIRTWCYFWHREKLSAAFSWGKCADKEYFCQSLSRNIFFCGSIFRCWKNLIKNLFQDKDGHKIVRICPHFAFNWKLLVSF